MHCVSQIGVFIGKGLNICNNSFQRKRFVLVEKYLLHRNTNVVAMGPEIFPHYVRAILFLFKNAQS